MSLTREIVITGAFDRRDPDPTKNYGIHGCELRFYLRGPDGVIQFVVYAPMHLPHVQDELYFRQRETGPYRYNPLKPIAADIGYHSPRPLYPGQEPIRNECHLLGGQCYYDGSSLSADPILADMLSGGSAAVWPHMERWYRERFGDQPGEDPQEDRAESVYPPPQNEGGPKRDWE